MTDLHLTMRSGQPAEFLWREEGGRFWSFLGGKKVVLWQEGEKVKSRGLSDNYVRAFLRLDDDMDEVYRTIGGTGAMERAIERFRGLRLTRNGLWETLVAFICSTNSNIPRIKKNVQSLLGQRGEIPGDLHHRNLAWVRLGYREKYLRDTSRLVAQGFLEGIEELGQEEARKRLMKLPGVGPKVADCVMLFALGRIETFPQDVWMKRAMKEYYGLAGEERIRKFAAENWSPYQGYAQQYLYLLAREEL